MTSPKVIALPDVLDISRVSEFHSTLVNDIKDGEAVSFDVKNVERVDAAFLQLLTAFCMNAESRNIVVEWLTPSEAFQSGVKILGLSEFLEIPASN